MFDKNIDNKNILDWIELYIYYNGYISKTDIMWEFTSLDDDSVDDIFFKLWNRLYIYWDFPPFEINNDIIKTINYNNIIEQSYILTLFLSVYWNILDTQKVWKIFERLTNEVLKKYLWWNSFVFWFPNWTWNPQNRIDQLAIDIDEKRWSDNPLPSAKDSKLDVISFKTIDNRKSKIVILTQSASWKNWETKLTDLSLKRWSSYINFAIDPIRAFSMPYFIDDNNVFYDKWLDWWLIFDRPRIYRFISELTSFDDSDLIQDIENWNNLAYNAYKQ